VKANEFSAFILIARAVAWFPTIQAEKPGKLIDGAVCDL